MNISTVTVCLIEAHIDREVPLKIITNSNTYCFWIGYELPGKNGTRLIWKIDQGFDTDEQPIRDPFSNNLVDLVSIALD